MSSWNDKVVWIVALQSSRSRKQSTELLLRDWLDWLKAKKMEQVGQTRRRQQLEWLEEKMIEGAACMRSRSTVSRRTHSTSQEKIRSELVWCEVYDCVQCEKRPEHFCILGIDMARVDLACEALALETR